MAEGFFVSLKLITNNGDSSSPVNGSHSHYPEYFYYTVECPLEVNAKGRVYEPFSRRRLIKRVITLVIQTSHTLPTGNRFEWAFNFLCDLGKKLEGENCNVFTEKQLQKISEIEDNLRAFEKRGQK